MISTIPQNLGKPPIGLDARRVVVEAEENVADIGVLLQHPEHGVLTGAAEGGIAVGLPILLVQREEGQQVDRSLEDIEPVAGSGVVKAVASSTVL